MQPDVSRWRLALFAFFFLPGVSMASWVTRTPAIRDRIGASIGEMGLVLFGLSIGSMTGILLSGRLVSRFGTRPVTQAGLWLVVAGTGTIGLATLLANPWMVSVGLALFGFGMGISEIAINVDGAIVEKTIERPVLHTLHGCFSLGTACGALVGLGLTAIAFPVEWHMAAVAVLGSILILSFQGAIPSGTAREEPAAAFPPSPTAPDTRSVVRGSRDLRLLMIGLIVLGMALAEGAANDWIPILMVDEYGFDQASGSTVYLAFAVAMTAGRFGGGYFLSRFDRGAVVRGSALLGALGIGIVVFVDNPILGGLAVILWGLGASLGFPVALSAAGDTGPDAATRVRLVAVAGYVAFLVGPPLLGFIGEHLGLRASMAVVLLMVLIAALVAGSARSAAPEEALASPALSRDPRPILPD